MSEETHSEIIRELESVKKDLKKPQSDLDMYIDYGFSFSNSKPRF